MTRQPRRALEREARSERVLRGSAERLRTLAASDEPGPFGFWVVDRTKGGGFFTFVRPRNAHPATHEITPLYAGPMVTIFEAPERA
jgi:hypothetical protein